MPEFLETVNNKAFREIKGAQIPEDQLVGTLWRAITTSLPSDWVFAGVMRRADAAFLPENSGKSWVAVAVKEGNLSLGPVPTLEGSGDNAPAAMGRLLISLSELEKSLDEDE